MSPALPVATNLVAKHITTRVNRRRLTEANASVDDMKMHENICAGSCNRDGGTVRRMLDTLVHSS